MPIALRGPRKAMRGKCERGRGSANADGGSVNAGAEVQTRTGRVRKSSRAMGTRRRRLSAPWPRFHGVDRADVYIIIRVCASYCGESALNPPTSPPILRRRPAPAPAQRHALPEHFLTPFPRSSAPPRSTDAHPQAAPCIPRRRPAPAPAQRHALPLPSCHIPAAPTHAHKLRNVPTESLLPPPPQHRPALPLRSGSCTKKRHRTVHVRCRMSRSTVVAVGHLGW